MGKQSRTQLPLGASKVRNNFKRNAGIRTGEKPHKCQRCSFAARYNYLLKVHGNVHTSEKPFKCRRCPFKTAYKSSLKSHEQNHTGEKPFKCRRCPFKTAFKSCLERHEQWHRGERPHTCTLCPFAAALKSHLEIHKRMHTGEKPFKCRYCSFKSSYEASLKTHERIHTGYKPFKCQHCPYVATQRSSVISHERTHTGERPFKCHRCNYASAHSSSLKTHQKIHPIRGNLSKLEHPTKLRSSLAPQKRLQSGRKSLKCKIPPKTTPVSSEKYAKITDLGSSRKQPNGVPYHLQDLLESGDEFYSQDTQLVSWDDQEINETSSQARFEIFICKECNYALFSEEELRMHYSFFHK